MAICTYVLFALLLKKCSDDERNPSNHLLDGKFKTSNWISERSNSTDSQMLRKKIPWLIITSWRSLHGLSFSNPHLGCLGLVRWEAFPNFSRKTTTSKKNSCTRFFWWKFDVKSPWNSPEGNDVLWDSSCKVKVVEKTWPSQSVVCQGVGETFNKLDVRLPKSWKNIGNWLENSMNISPTKVLNTFPIIKRFFSESSCHLSPKFCGAELGGPKSLAYNFLTKTQDFYWIFRGHWPQTVDAVTLRVHILPHLFQPIGIWIYTVHV